MVARETGVHGHGLNCELPVGGGLEDLISAMEKTGDESRSGRAQSQVQYAALVVRARDAANSCRSKFVGIFYAPEAASPRAKAVAAQHRTTIMGSGSLLIRGAHVEFEVQDLQDLTAAEIVQKLLASGGAHAASTFVL